ncbi:MAG: hypothetical protein WBV78_15375 [Roseobacter sp.]
MLLRRSIGHLSRIALLLVHGGILILLPTTAVAHDAFGDLGPFYGSMLHPLADPLQAAVLVGTAAFLAGRSLSVVRGAIPIFVLLAGFASVAAFSGTFATPPPVVAGFVALLAGLAAALPENWSPWPLVYALMALAGAVTGLAPGVPDEGLMLQTLLGSLFGFSALVTLLWFTFEAAGRRLTPLVPKVIGSWVAAVGILVVAFSA